MIVSNKKVNKTKIKLKSLVTWFFLLVFAVWWKEKKSQWEWVEKKKTTFTCCRNTFPSLNAPRGRSQYARGHNSHSSFWMLDVSAGKKNVQTCAQRMGGSGKGGGSLMRRALDVLRTGNTRRRATAGGYVCIWTLREKATNSILFFFFFICQTTTASTMPPPNPAGSVPDPTELQTGGSCERVGEWRVGGGAWHPGGDSSGGFVSMCAVLICYLTHARARTLTWPWCYHRENSHPDKGPARAKCGPPLEKSCDGCCAGRRRCSGARVSCCGQLY